MSDGDVYPEGEYLLVQIRRRRGGQSATDVAEDLLATLVRDGWASDLAIVGVVLPPTAEPVGRGGRLRTTTLTDEQR